MLGTTIAQLEDVKVEVIKKKKITRINIIVDGKTLCLSNERTNAFNYLNYTVTKRYIVACLNFTKGLVETERVTGLYDREEQCIIQVTKANRDAIKYVLVTPKTFYLSTVLEYLNHGKAEAATEQECEEFEDFLTSGRKVSRNEVEEWIYKAYPMLKEFANKDEPMKIEVYLAALQKVGKEDLQFYAMPITF